MYFSTFITGLSEVVKNELIESIQDISIKSVQDGLIIYGSSCKNTEIISLRFLNNTFTLIKTFKDVENSTQSINRIIKNIIQDNNLFYHLKNKVPQYSKTFRIIISVENQMTRHDKNVLPKLENKIIEATNLKVHKSLPDVEFWLYIRREKHAYFGIRLTHNKEQKKILARGELRSELSHILAYISNPSKNDVFLDPFSGSGSIPKEIIKSFPYRKIIVIDNDKILVDKLGKYKDINKKNVVIQKMNALHLYNIKNETINKIVTDPPWGITMGKNLNLNVFYKNMLNEFKRILVKNGVAIILMGNNDIFENILNNNDFTVEKTYNILVSGKKARIYTLVK